MAYVCIVGPVILLPAIQLSDEFGCGEIVHKQITKTASMLHTIIKISVLTMFVLSLIRGTGVLILRV
jgi:hypothetical protein